MVDSRQSADQVMVRGNDPCNPLSLKKTRMQKKGIHKPSWPTDPERILAPGLTETAGLNRGPTLAGPSAVGVGEHRFAAFR